MKKYAVEVLFMSACAGMFLPVFAWGGTDVNIDNPLAECVDNHAHERERGKLPVPVRCSGPGDGTDGPRRQPPGIRV